MVPKKLLLALLALLWLLTLLPKSRDLVANTEGSSAVSLAPARIAPLPGAPVKDVTEPDLSRFTFATRWSESKEPALAAFSQWAETYVAADLPTRVTMQSEGVALVKVRRAHVKELIRTHPKAALAFTIPAAVRAELPSAVDSELEQRVTGKGDFVVLGRAEPISTPAISRRAIINGATYEAHVFGKRLSQRSAQNVSLHGIALDGEIALSDSPLRAFEPGEVVPAHKPLAADSCVVSKQPTSAPTKQRAAAESGDAVYWLCRGGHIEAAAEGVAEAEAQFQAYATSGERSLLVMLVDFSDVPGAPVDAAIAQRNLDTVAEFFKESSYGQFEVSTRTVTSVLRMPGTAASYRDTTNGDTKLLNDARAAAAIAGYAPSQYTFDIVAFGQIGYLWSGLGYIGSKGAWVQGALPAATIAHELGHNLGVWHANFWKGGTSPIDAAGAHSEYGNEFDVMGKMGHFPKNHYNANFKTLLGWLPETNIETVTNSGTYRIYAHDLNAREGSRKYGLRIPAGLVRGSEVEDYWIELRQQLAPLYPNTATAPLVFWGNDYGSASASRLLDVGFATMTKTDAPLSVSNSLIDEESGIRITTLSAQGQGADAYVDVDISLSKLPALSLATALDNTTLGLASSTWAGQTALSHDGVDAAASGTTADSDESHIDLTVVGPGTVSFWWKVSSEAEFDVLKLVVDGREIDRISGEIDWRQRSFDVGAGAHYFRWTYKKDSSAVGGSDRAWLDQVAFKTGYRAPVINIAPTPVVTTVGKNAQFTVEAGGSVPRWIQWSFDGVDIPNAISSTLVITNVQIADAGRYSVRLTSPFGSAESSAMLSVVPVSANAGAPKVAWSAGVVTISSLSGSGKVVLESSTNLTTWIAVATNHYSAGSISIKRPGSNRVEFLRARFP